MRKHEGGFDDAGPASAAAIGDAFDPPFEVLEPGGPAAPLLFTSPHSGNLYPDGFVCSTRLDALTLRRSEDAFVDELFEGALKAGAPLIRARFPRAYLDVNREPYELDPRMFEGRLPAFANTRSIRVAGGLGTIARVVGDAQEIYAGRLPVAEALRRIEALYKPWHRTLRDRMTRIAETRGMVTLIDCHSMPSPAARGARSDDAPRADIVLGDRYGTSCHPALIDAAELELRRLGYSVTRNKPYAGGFITEHYGNPAIGWHTLQIEINRGIYMDEKDITRGPGFAELKSDLTQFARVLAEACQLPMPGRSAAAE